MLAMLAVAVLAFAYLLIADRTPGYRLMLFLMLASYALLFLVVNGVRNFLKRRKASRALNRGVTLAVDVALAFVLMGAIMGGVFWGITTGRISSMEKLTDPPLSVEELTGVVDSRYITRCQADSTFFITQRNFYQHIPFEQRQAGEQLESLDYTIVDIHLPALYPWCVEELLHDRDDWSGEMEDGQPFYYQYQAIDPAPWGAERAYQLWAGGEPATTYLICWQGRIVELDPTFALTQEQTTIAAEKLAP